MIEEEKNLPYSEIRVPTYLRNLPLVRAFQHVVAMYSLPSYGEIDPSFFVAVTFCLFFGFMFGMWAMAWCWVWLPICFKRSAR